MIESGTRLSFVLLVLFTIPAFLWGNWLLGFGELLLVGCIYWYYLSRSRRRASEIRKYVETLAFSMDDASKHSMVNFPLPMIILRVDSG